MQRPASLGGSGGTQKRGRRRSAAALASAVEEEREAMRARIASELRASIGAGSSHSSVVAHATADDDGAGIGGSDDEDQQQRQPKRTPVQEVRETPSAAPVPAGLTPAKTVTPAKSTTSPENVARVVAPMMEQIATSVKDGHTQFGQQLARAHADGDQLIAEKVPSRGVS